MCNLSSAVNPSVSQNKLGSQHSGFNNPPRAAPTVTRCSHRSPLIKTFPLFSAGANTFRIVSDLLNSLPLLIKVEVEHLLQSVSAHNGRFGAHWNLWRFFLISKWSRPVRQHSPGYPQVPQSRQLLPDLFIGAGFRRYSFFPPPYAPLPKRNQAME